MAGELIVRPTAQIVPLPQAFVWHEMAQQILAMSLERAVLKGALSPSTCEHLRTAARKLDTFHVRALVTLVLDKMEQQDATITG